MGLPAHQATTAQLGAAYPFMSEGGLGGRGVLIGRDLLGGSFAYDPFQLYGQGVITNPNMVVIGQIGRGKSALVKTYLWRQSVFGRRAWIVDPKGEYGPLARAFGVRPVALRPGGSVRLNPLEPRPGRGGLSSAELLYALAEASLGRGLSPRERTAAELALAGAAARGVPTLPGVVSHLLDPAPEAAASVRTDVASLRADGRDLALELRRLVAGDLRGMFDGPSTPGVDLGAPVVVLDLSAVYSSPALGVLMACASGWLQAGLERAGRDKLILVVDEAWAILANLGVARWLRSSWKLSRAHGVANLAVLHRLSDLGAAGAAGSEQAALAGGVLSDSETRVAYGQAPGEVGAARELLGLTDTEAGLLARLGRGVSLWKVGSRSFLVQHRLAPGERWLVDTDARMAEGR
jgi:hypothetical protein